MRLNSIGQPTFKLILALTLGLQSFVAFATPASSVAAFMRAEANNSYEPPTTVRDEFKPQTGARFPIKYLVIPAADLHVVDSAVGSATTRSHLLFTQGRQSLVKFFIHPDSEELYAPLIKKYGVAGTYTAMATASTRTLLAWPNDQPQNLVFLKLSLAQQQDGLGRIIPGWEVRRSVGISEVAGLTDPLQWRASGASIISEFAGAYVDRGENLGFKIDSKQGTVFEHGLIAREASFLNEFPEDETLPLFALFTRGRLGEKPRIIQYWEEAQKSRKISFEAFVGEFLFEPFLEMNKYLLFHEGIVPEFHGQNVVVVLDKDAKRIKHFFHRDVGSMKVDLRMRWVHGLPIAPLRTENAIFDFKFDRAPSAIQEYLRDYLNDWIFRWSYKADIQHYVPNFNPSTTAKLLDDLAVMKVRATLPLRSATKFTSIAKHIEQYWKENIPLAAARLDKTWQFDADKVRQFIAQRVAQKQTLSLPSEWVGAFESLPAVTDYGVVYAPATGSLALALHSSRDLVEIQTQGASAYKYQGRKPSLRIGFYTGTFDPPHRGHEQILKDAINQLNLDVVIVVPNAAPPHKPNALAFSDRRDMVRAAFAQIPQVIVGTESDANDILNTGATTQINKLAKAHADHQIFQIMGSDSLERMQEYRVRYESNITIAVSGREPGYQAPRDLHGIPVVQTPNETNGLSSTKVRAALADRKDPGSAVLHPTVLSLIRERKLYAPAPTRIDCMKALLTRNPLRRAQ